MAKGPKPLVAGNWKMNGTKASLKEIRQVASKTAKGRKKPSCELMIFPPFTLVAQAREAVKGARVRIGGQDCHAAESGAHTGDVSAEMLADSGARAVIVGHSERRADHGETDRVVAEKAAAAHRAGLVAVICIGETEQQRDAGRTLATLTTRLKGSLPDTANDTNTVIAYEPVWAIGTGRTPSEADIAAAHAHIRKRLTIACGEKVARKMRILYGGSVKPDNAASILAVSDVDGALVGGASLKAKDLLAIAAACPD